MSIDQKAKEISYALFRVAVYIRRTYLKERIEQLAFQLAEQVATEDLKAGIRTLTSLSVLVELGKQVYEIEKNNALVLLREFGALNAAIRQIAELDSANTGVPVLESMFSKQPITLPTTNAAIVNEGSARPLPGIMQDSAMNQANGNGITATIRQSAILDKIRQSNARGGQAGNLPLKDIIAAFPEVSERTMRYDLQKLCAQGLIERVGNGGPASYYVIK
ncbi:MAG: hypothetical protein G01um10143_193 [Parcubacteria group bacterium Gr01-1014_3]|nr:MAG: hypothetical protein G01um10143_193 [Parcubacteria group bacterium Gr01-1014_3]